jgi:hypothetical protein
MLDILNAVQNDMLLILYDRTDAWQRIESTDLPVTSNFLGVTQQPKRRRKSSGNIARNLGPELASSLREERPTEIGE